MKSPSLFCTGAVCFLVSPSVAAAETAAVFWDTARDQAADVAEAAETLSAYDAVLFGEFHDSAPIHELEASLFRALSDLHGDRQVLSLEMFERDVQDVLDAYLAGDVGEEEFLATARPWPRYHSDYRDMVELARERGIPVIASNVPRRLAAVLAKTGSLDEISEADRQWLPEETWAPHGSYRDKFMETMKEAAAAGMPVDPDRMEDMYRAQCLKDDAMAESIAYWLDAHPGARVLHVQGDFHGTDRLGVAEKLSRLRPSIRVAVVTPVKGSPFDNETARAEFLIILPRDTE